MRVESPSSINTYKQCPRKYYYQYIEKLETKESIHTLRGGIVHKVMEEFFTLDSISDTGYHLSLQLQILSLFKKHWNSKLLVLCQLVNPEELSFFEHESQIMLVNWLGLFTKRLETRMRSGMNSNDAFASLRPKAEQELMSTTHRVRGFIDAIEEGEDGLRIMDYKTSKSIHITDQYRLQLAIYALLYEENHGRRPDKVGIYFLKGSERLLEVDDRLISLAKMEIANIHRMTQIQEKPHYPMKPSRLCKWSTGQCDFFEHCYANDLQYAETLLQIKQ
jgi:CRISPR/Cas system-associated exonuclease Cas4 (RecB family)